MKEIKFPANYAVVNESDLAGIEGGGVFASIFYALGTAFRSTKINYNEQKAQTLTQSHGEVVSVKGGVYTYADGTTFDTSSGFAISFVVGDLFNGIGRLLNIFDL